MSPGVWNWAWLVKDQGLGLDDRFFPINRKRGWQIITAAAARAGLPKMDLHKRTRLPRSNSSARPKLWMILATA